MEIIECDGWTLRYTLPGSSTDDAPLEAASLEFVATFFNTTVDEARRLLVDGHFLSVQVGRERYVTMESLKEYAIEEFFRRREAPLPSEPADG